MLVCFSLCRIDQHDHIHEEVHDSVHSHRRLGFGHIQDRKRLVSGRLSNWWQQLQDLPLGRKQVNKLTKTATSFLSILALEGTLRNQGVLKTVNDRTNQFA